MNTNTKFHVGIHVSDISKSVSFYQDLLRNTAVKVKSDYAKIENDQLVLSLIKRASKVRSDFGHFGFRVENDEQLQAHHKQLKDAGHILAVEENVDCCYAIQNKFWVKDPDGFDWEIYTFIEDTDESIRPAAKLETAATEEACCGTDCCT